MSPGAPDRRGNAAGDGDMVVLDEDGIVETEAVVRSRRRSGPRISESARRPGMVLRVQVMRASVPARRAANAAVAVATPERWQTKLRATRSAARIERAVPETRATTSPAASRRPSSMRVFEADRAGSTSRNAHSASARPARTPGFRATMRRDGGRLGGDGRVRRDVAGEAEILLERGAYCIGRRGSRGSVGRSFTRESRTRGGRLPALPSATQSSRHPPA